MLFIVVIVVRENEELGVSNSKEADDVEENLRPAAFWFEQGDELSIGCSNVCRTGVRTRIGRKAVLCSVEISTGDRIIGVEFV